MDILFPIVAFLATFLMSQRSLAGGILSVITVGYFSGIIRANFQSIATTFFFDAAVAGLYISVGFGHTRTLKRAIMGSGGQFCMLLVIWPAFLTLVPVNHFLVQLVALRGTVWLLPLFILATKLKLEDLKQFARVLAVLNTITFFVGTYIYINGVESLYPKNEVTRIIYQSKDVRNSATEDNNHRVPSTFLSAHAYGGTMVLTLPLLLGRLFQRKPNIFERGLLIAGVLSALVGLLYCGARQPLWVFCMLVILTWIQSGMSAKAGIYVFLLAGTIMYFSMGNERFQRGFSVVSTDGDKMFVGNRLKNSINEELYNEFFLYPLGSGMGSSFGTSLPYFLSHLAPEIKGQENEYSRILIDQGWIGLGLWLAFLYWVHFPRPRSNNPDISLLLCMTHSTTALIWATAFIGAGILSSIPGTALLLVNMGVLVGHRENEARRIKMSKVRRILINRISEWGRFSSD